jgi:ligand-binding sensor domain-containing protein/signal transduction histidine kinase
MLFAVLITYAQPVLGQGIKFKPLLAESGLSHRSVSCLLQDYIGFMWVGTQNGLNYWDGYSFKVFRNNPQDSNSLSHSIVQTIFEDKQHRLWIGTRSGLNLFVRETGTFKRIKCPGGNDVWAIHDGGNGQIWVGTDFDGLFLFDPETQSFKEFKIISNDPSANRIITLYKDSKQRFWVGTYAGLYLFNSDRQTFESYVHEPANPSSLSQNWVYSITEDKGGKLWVGTRFGLNLFDPETKTFQRYLHNPTDTKSVSSVWIPSVYVDSSGKIWIGTYDGGLNTFNPNTKTFEHFLNNPRDPSSLSHNSISSIKEDNSGQLWVGTLGGGINLLPVKPKPIFTFRNDPNDPTSLSNNIVQAVCEDQAGRVWVGTEDGLNLFVSKSQSFKHFRNNPNNSLSLPENYVFCVYEDHNQQLWVGTNGGGLNLYNRVTNTVKQYKNNPEDEQSLSIDQVSVIYEDHSNRFWVGTYGGGLNLFNSKTGVFKRYMPDSNNPKSLSHRDVFCIFEDGKGNLWVGTRNGLNILNRQDDSFERFVHDSKDQSSLSGNAVFFVHEDQSGRLWVGTNTDLNLFNPTTRTFERLKKSNEFPENRVHGMLEDSHGRLWLSTDAGITMYTPHTNPGDGHWGTFRNYESDGTEDFGNTTFKGKDGKMYFGGVNGLNIFHPDSIRDNLFMPPIVITELELLNKPVVVGQDYDGFVMPVSISLAKELVLTPKQSVFTLAFSSLSFIRSDKNKYAYKLEGFDKEWNYTDSRRRFATYTNLDPGTYTFRVKGSNHDGLWNETGTTLKIIVQPAWWETLWFRASLFILLVSMVVIASRQRTSRMMNMNKILAKHQSDLLRSSVEVQEAERKRIAQDMHDELGAVLSITRMQLVQLEQQQANEAIGSELRRARESTESALTTMRRLSHELMPPQLETFGFAKTLETICEQINASNEIKMQFIHDEEPPRYPANLELALYRICMELITNTLKHANAKNIRIEFSQGIHQIFLTYQDDGRGISENNLQGLGIKNMEARINAVGGGFEFTNARSGGFYAAFHIPITNI